MREVTKYEANDGRLFDTESDALIHDALVELAGWYEDNKLYGRYEGCRIEWEDLVAWVETHRNKVAALVQLV